MTLSPHTLLLQTTSQTELENWITAIHSACAAAVARHHHKEDTLRLLKSEIRKLEQKVDMDEKMKKMGEMQLSSVTDAKKKKTILDQVTVPLRVEPADLLGLHFFCCLRIPKDLPSPWQQQPVTQTVKLSMVTVSFPRPLFRVDCYELKGTM